MNKNKEEELRRSVIGGQEENPKKVTKRGFALIVLLVSLTMGCGMIITPCAVWVMSDRFGVPGSLFTLLGVTLVGLTLWGKVHIKAGTIEVTFEHNKDAIRHLFAILIAVLGFFFLLRSTRDYVNHYKIESERETQARERAEAQAKEAKKEVAALKLAQKRSRFNDQLEEEVAALVLEPENLSYDPFVLRRRRSGGARGLMGLLAPRSRPLKLTLDNYSKGSIKPPPTRLYKIDVAVAALQLDDSLAVTIHGYTDSTGSPEGNRALSAKRAEAVRDALVSKDIKAKIQIIGHGEEDPIAPNSTREGRAANRRVVLEIRKGEHVSRPMASRKPK